MVSKYNVIVNSRIKLDILDTNNFSNKQSAAESCVSPVVQTGRQRQSTTTCNLKALNRLYGLLQRVS